jgi:hypothetical protein
MEDARISVVPIRKPYLLRLPFPKHDLFHDTPGNGTPNGEAFLEAICVLYDLSICGHDLPTKGIPEAI